MFERFTERATRVVVLAQEEARTLKHHHVAPEHILLGLLREEQGLAARVLESLDVTVERVRAQVVRIVGSGAESTPGQLPFTPRAREVLELALREALWLGHNYVGTEHILLSLVREIDGVAARILLDSDADAVTVRTEVVRMLGGPAGADQLAQHGRSRLPRAATDDGASRLLAAVAPQIERHLGRPADAGDLLVALASVPEGFAARILADLGIDSAALTRAAAEARREHAPSVGGAGELEREIATVREQKAAMIEAQDFKAAAELRDRERRLVRRAGQAGREPSDNRLDRALTELRARLGLPSSSA